MNELEELLRGELCDRVAAAEPEELGLSPSGRGLAAGVETRLRRVTLRRRWIAAACSGTAIAAAVAIALGPLAPGHNGGGPVPVTGPLSTSLSDPAATPPGWTPLTFGAAQISVPSSWVVQGHLGSICHVTRGGGVVIGGRLHLAALRAADCRLPPTAVFLWGAPARPRPVLTGRVNGIAVARRWGPGSSRSEVAPGLGVGVTALGPEAGRVLATLTRSPQSVVLSQRPPAPVPAGWRWHAFGGIKFATPAGWATERTRFWGSCNRRPLQPRPTVVLSLAARRPCITLGFLASLAGSYAPQTGVAAGSGPLATADIAADGGNSCMRLSGLRACVLRTGSAGVYLALAVHPTGLRPVVLEIGLAGTGVIPRAIMDSIRPR